MRVSWRKVGRGIESIVVVALVFAVAMLWQRDRPDVVTPESPGEPVRIARAPAAGRTGTVANDETKPVRQEFGTSPVARSAAMPLPAELSPTPEQYRTHYELVMPNPVAGTAVDCGSFDVTPAPTAEEFQNPGNQPYTTLKIATTAPNQSLFVERIRAAAKVVAARTSGGVSIKIYAGGTQGTPERVLQKIKIGQLQGGTFTPADFQNVYSDLSIYGLPFFFDSDAEIRYVRERMDGTLTGGLHEAGFVNFGFVGSFAHLMSSQPFYRLQELRMARTWAPEGGALLINWMGLYFIPFPRPITDILTGLRTGLLNAVIVPPEVAVAHQWHSMIPFVVDQPVSYAMTFMAVSRRAFEGLSRQDREIVASELRRVYCEMNRMSGVQAAEALERMVKSDATVLTLPDDEWQRLRQGAREYGARMVESGHLSAELYFDVQRLTEEYRILGQP